MENLPFLVVSAALLQVHFDTYALCYENSMSTGGVFFVVGVVVFGLFIPEIRKNKMNTYVKFSHVFAHSFE